jgi:hypothetical protein
MRSTVLARRQQRVPLNQTITDVTLAHRPSTIGGSGISTWLPDPPHQQNWPQPLPEARSAHAATGVTVSGQTGD